MCSVQTGDSSKKAKLANAFAVKARQICSGEKCEVMQKWLEDSFDSTEEIEELIANAPGVADANANQDRIYLDLDSGIDLTRKDLLEVSKSCYSGVLQKLTQIFTHIKVSSNYFFSCFSKR